MKIEDITDQVEFLRNDDESLPLIKCACGIVYDAWDFILGMDSEYPDVCSHCNRKMYFKLTIQVFEIKEDG